MITQTRIAYLTVLVRDVDAAFKWYSEMLGFERREDFSLAPSERWLTMGLPGQPDFSIVLDCPSREVRGADLYAILAARIGKGSLLVLTTPDCRGVHRELIGRGVRFLSEPSEFPWGITALLEDLYGNGISLLQPIVPHDSLRSIAKMRDGTLKRVAYGQVA